MNTSPAAQLYSVILVPPVAISLAFSHVFTRPKVNKKLHGNILDMFHRKCYCWWKKSCNQLIGSLSHDLQGFYTSQVVSRISHWVVPPLTSEIRNLKVFRGRSGWIGATPNQRISFKKNPLGKDCPACPEFQGSGNEKVVIAPLFLARTWPIFSRNHDWEDGYSPPPVLCHRSFGILVDI